MRFKRWPRPEPFRDTHLKRLAFRRKVAAERERWPLLARIEQPPNVDHEMFKRAKQWARDEQRWRNQRATQWRYARRLLASHGDNSRRTIRALWQEAPYPADPVYLLDMLTSIREGRIDIDNPPWRI